MKMMNAEDNKLVFGLDIGTRSIVGTVGYRISTGSSNTEQIRFIKSKSVWKSV